MPYLMDVHRCYSYELVPGGMTSDNLQLVTIYTQRLGKQVDHCRVGFAVFRWSGHPQTQGPVTETKNLVSGCLGLNPHP